MTLVIAMLNKSVDINNLKIPNYILFYLCAITGSIMVILISTRVQSKILKYIGMNSLIVMSVHEPIKRIVIIIFSKITKLQVDFIRGNIFCILGVTIMIILVIMPIIFFINKYMPFIIGKSKKLRVK